MTKLIEDSETACAKTVECIHNSVQFFLIHAIRGLYNYFDYYRVLKRNSFLHNT